MLLILPLSLLLKFTLQKGIVKIGSPPANPNADQPLTRAVRTIGSRGKGNTNFMHPLMDICG